MFKLVLRLSSLLSPLLLLNSCVSVFRLLFVVLRGRSILTVGALLALGGGPLSFLLGKALLVTSRLEGLHHVARKASLLNLTRWVSRVHLLVPGRLVGFLNT